MPVSYKYDFSKNGTLETGLALGVLVHYYEEANGSEQVAGALVKSRTSNGELLDTISSLIERETISNQMGRESQL